MAESRLEKWNRTGWLHIVTTAVVGATWFYFQKQPVPDRPIIINELLLATFTWLGAKFFVKTEKKEAEAKAADPVKEPEEEVNGGRHRAK